MHACSSCVLPRSVRAGLLAQLARLRAPRQRAQVSKHANIFEACSFSKRALETVRFQGLGVTAQIWQCVLAQAAFIAFFQDVCVLACMRSSRGCAHRASARD